MGKKNSVFKNIMVTLGCTAFAGVYVVGGGYAVSTLMGGQNGARPAWMDRVEIRVGENASQGTSSGASMKYSGNNDRSNSGDTLQQPRFEEDEEETQTEEYESETETELEPEAETETETESEPSEDEDEKDEKATKDDKETDREFVEVSHVQTIEQEGQGAGSHGRRDSRGKDGDALCRVHHK